MPTLCRERYARYGLGGCGQAQLKPIGTPPPAMKAPERFSLGPQAVLHLASVRRVSAMIHAGEGDVGIQATVVVDGICNACRNVEFISAI